MNLLCLRSDQSLLNFDYAFYYFRTPFFRRAISKIWKKAVNQASFPISSLRKVEIPLPTLNDQIKIALILKKTINQIELRKTGIDLLNLLMKSTFLEMFGDPILNEKKWKKLPLNALTKIATGSTPSRKSGTDYYNGSFNWVKTTEVDGGYVYETEEKITEQALIDSTLLCRNLRKLWVEGSIGLKEKLQNLPFPNGLVYDKEKGAFRTPDLNYIIAEIALTTGDFAIIKKGLSFFNQRQSLCAEKEGFEPPEV
jgi:hypothetical protein